MTTDELNEIEERWRFGTNTRDDVRRLLDEIARLRCIIDRAANVFDMLEVKCSDVPATWIS